MAEKAWWRRRECRALRSVACGGSSVLRHHYTVRWSETLQEMHAYGEPPVEFGEPVRAETLDLFERQSRRSEQRIDVDALAVRRERTQIVRAARQHVDRPVMVETPQMMEGDADLQDALVEAAHLARLLAPQPF